MSNTSPGNARRQVVAVTGASGNIGTALLRRLVPDPRVGEVRAIARRPPDEARPEVRWIAADITADDLAEAFDGVDAVVHLAWRIQPSWDVAAMERVNVEGSRRVFEVAARAGAAIVHASSVGAYGPGPQDRLVDESWPLGGHPGHPYSLQKARVEGLLDVVEDAFPGTRVVRMRPGLVFQRAAGQEVRRYFLPRHTPGFLLQPALVQQLPVRFQAVHADDVAAAFAEAALGDRHGAFNVATTDPIGRPTVGALEHLARPLAALSWRAHLQPVDPGWVRLVFRCPLIDPARAQAELHWRPAHSGAEALAEGLRAMAEPPAPASDALAAH